MSADWQAGDRAVCVEPFQMIDTYSGKQNLGDRPEVGTVYLVTGTKMSRITHNLGLFLAGLYSLNPRSGNECTYTASKFRKLVPALDLARRHAEGVKS